MATPCRFESGLRYQFQNKGSGENLGPFSLPVPGLPRPVRKSKRPRSARSQGIIRAQLAWWRDEIGEYLLSDVTPALLAEARDHLAADTARTGKPLSPATVVRYMAPLSHAFGVAVREWGWVDDSPMRKVERPAEPRGRVRFLDDDERARLLQACRASASPDLYPAVILALSTGARHAEIMGLRWPQIDFNRCVAILTETSPRLASAKRNSAPCSTNHSEANPCKKMRLHFDLFRPLPHPLQLPRMRQQFRLIHTLPSRRRRLVSS